MMGAAHSNDCYILQLHHRPGPVSMRLIWALRGWGKNPKEAGRRCFLQGEEDCSMIVKGLVTIGKHAAIIMWRRVCARAAVPFILGSRG